MVNEFKEPELKPCPFCGSQKVGIKSQVRLDGYVCDLYRVIKYTYSVRCNRCHARGSTAGGRVIDGWDYNINPLTGEALDERGPQPLPKWATTPDVLKARAFAAWNRRENNG